MPIVTDPDQLNDGATDNGTTEVFINTATKRIKINAVGNVSNSGAQNQNGVTEKCVYSFIKEEWRLDPHAKNLAAFPFPFTPITDEFFELVSGWDWADDTTRNLVRNGGWLVRNTSGNVTDHRAGIKTTGSTEANDQVYYQTVGASGSSAAVNFVATGPVNQAVQVVSDPNGDGNYADGFSRADNIKVFNREQGQLYSLASTLGNGESSLLAPKVFGLDASTGTDLKVTHTDVQIDADANNVADVAPYSGMSITYYAAAQSRTIGGVARNFGIVINGNNGTAEEIYEFVQWSMRRSTDIDAGAGTVTGKTADELLEFVGDTLKTLSATNPAGGGSGVYIDNFQTIDITRLVFVDNTGTERTYPYVANLRINFGNFLQNDPSAKFWVYYKTLPGAGNDYGEAGAIIVNNASDVPMTGNVSGAAFIDLPYAYGTNAQGGRTPGTDAQLVVVGLGLATGQYVVAETTLVQSTTNSVSLVAAQERQYAN